ncbi:hypothetical protein [Flavobacterium sp.]|uniref:hypothetical protein n=1 Tax=Flavobacterium sp. TaxID=239 RepID=UPI0037522A68
MKKYFIAFLIILLFSFQLPFRISGKYKVVYDKKYYPNIETDCVINLKENNYTKTQGQNKICEGGISRISYGNSKTIIYLQDFYFSHPRAELNNIKPKGYTIIEFEESDLDTISFRTTFTKQLNITINTGKLIRME